MNWISVHENAAAEYDQMAAETDNPTLRNLYSELAAKRRSQAALERAQIKPTLDAPSPQDLPDYWWQDNLSLNDAGASA